MKLSNERLADLYRKGSHRSPARVGCPSSDELVASAMGERPAASPDAVVRHIAECSDCAEEHRIAQALRPWATPEPERIEARARAPFAHSPRPAGWLASAAALLAVCLAVMPFVRVRETTWRGQEPGGFSLSVADTGAAFVVAWPLREAETYAVDVTDAEGEVVLTRRVTGPPVEIAKADLAGPRKTPLYVRVQALRGPGQDAVASATSPLRAMR